MTTKECCEKCHGLDKRPSGVILGDVCYDSKCSCHRQPSAEWENWVRTLANSTNPKDVDLLVAKVAVLIEQAREEFKKDFSIPHEILAAAIQDGVTTGRTAALEEVMEMIDETKKDGWSNFGKRDLTEAEEAHNTALSDLAEAISKEV